MGYKYRYVQKYPLLICIVANKVRVVREVLRVLLLYFIRVFKTVGSDTNSQRAVG